MCKSFQSITRKLRTFNFQLRDRGSNPLRATKNTKMYKEPREQIKDMFDQIQSINGNISNNSINKILKYLVKEILNSNPSGWYNDGNEWEKEFFCTPVNDGWVDAEKYWNFILILIDEKDE